MEDILPKDHGGCLKEYVKGKRPYPHYYRLDLDITNKIYVYGISRYQKFIGTLIWFIELGCIEINMKVRLKIIFE